MMEAMTMKQIIAMLLAAFLLLPLGIAQMADVAVARPAIMPIPPGEDLTLSQNHFYSVNFDGEGEATVATKISIQNTGKEKLDEVKIEVPGTSVRLINALQEVQQKSMRCGYWPGPIVYPSDKSYEEVPEEHRAKCQNWYETYDFKYYSLEREENKLSKSVQYTFTLPKPIGDQETAKIILYYKAEGYTDRSAGVFDFDFETLKINQDINQIRVAVTVQDDLFLEGVESEVEYRGGAMLKTMETAMAPAPSGVASADIQQFSSQIEWAPGLVKEARGLDPLESFHVTGRYAKSRIALYQGKIWTSAIVLLLAVLGMAFGARRLLSGKAKSSSPTLAVVGGGLISAVGMFVVWVIAFMLMAAMRQMVDYQLQSMVGLLIMLISVLISLALLIGTPVLVGYRHGIPAGLMTVGVMMLTLLVLTIIAVVFLIAMGGSVGGPRIMY